jgi:arylsulfatase A-like enzyme/Tfp pilus assembly protein PilF
MLIIGLIGISCVGLGLALSDCVRRMARLQPARFVTRNSVLGCFALAILTCSSAHARPSTPVILISVDTLRADRLSCYQSGRRFTPHIDALAKNGTLFSDVSSVVPLTLPSHVALFTSTYPFVNHVQENGIPLAPGQPTLTTVLKDNGYRTAAFVGTFILDRRFGLSRGFDVYDSPFDLRKQTTTDTGDLKRRGSEVASAAMHWLQGNSNAPFFLFLHLYDLHTPYDLPPNSGARGGEAGYEAELAYVDRVLGEFLTHLEANGVLNRSLVVFTSDHGEGLGDHGESTHGYFVYQSTIHVPLIIHWPENSKRMLQGRVSEPASLLDVGPTILDALGVSRPKEMQGRSLIRTENTEPIYSESLYAQKHFGCAVLRSLRLQRYKYIGAPQPELYDLATDPGELRNLYDRQRSTAAALRERIALLRAGSQADQAGRSEVPDAVATAALRSLGYLSGAPSAGVKSHIDPKNRIADFEEFGHASALASAGQIAASTALLEKLQQKLPNVPDISISLGLNQQRAGRYADAARTFGHVVEQNPVDARAHFDLALCLHRLHQPDKAIRELRAALALEPWYTRAEELLANIYLQTQKYEQARASLQHILSIDPYNYTAHYDLAVFAAMQENWPEAQQEVLAALRTDSGSAEGHNMLGSVYLRRGQFDQAQTELQQAIHLQRNFVSAHYNLALVLEKKGQKKDAAEELATALKIDPQFTAARKELDALERSTH